MYMYFNKAKAFLETFSESGFKLLNFLSLLIFKLLSGEKMLEENRTRVQFSCYKDNIKNHQDLRIKVLFPSVFEVFQEGSNELHTSM